MVTLAQNFDQVRLGLQTAKELSRQAQGNLSALGLVSDRTPDPVFPNETFQPSRLAEQAGAETTSRDLTRSTLAQALSTINEMGLPPSETESLRSAIEEATHEDNLGVFDQMQIKAGVQLAEKKLEETNLQRTSAAAGASEARQSRVEGQVDTALDILTDLEMKYGGENVSLSEDIPGWTPGQAQTEPPAPASAPVTVESPTAPLTIGVSPWSGNDAYSSSSLSPWGGYQSNVSPSLVPVGGNYATGPIADFGNSTWTSSPASNSGTTAQTSSEFNPRALSEAVWGSGYTPFSSTSTDSTPPNPSGTSGNVMTDFLLERGEFTPKKKDEESEDA